MPIYGTASPVAAPAALLADFTLDIVPSVGSVALTQLHAAAAYVTNSTGGLSSIPANTPKRHHVKVGSSWVPCGWLMEPARNNKILVSAAFENATWTKSNLTATDADATGPDGTTSATRLTEATDTAQLHRVFQQFEAVVSGRTYCASFYAKAGTRTQISWQSTSFFQGNVNFDLVAGKAFVGVDNGYGAEAWMEPQADGWWRCILKNVAVASGSGNFILALYKTLATTFSDTYDGDGSSLLIWGPQLEEGDAPTSHIPTVSSYTTRVADSLSITGSDFSSVYAVANTIALTTRGSGRETSQTLLKIDDTTSNNEIKLATDANGYSVATITSGGSSSFSSTINSRYRNFQENKTVLSFESSHSIHAKSGLLGSLDTGVAMPVNPTRMLIGSDFNGCISKLEIYGSRKSDRVTQALSGALRSATQPATYKPSKILCDGNSLTYGFGANGGGNYPYQLRELLEAVWDHAFTLQNFGVSGQTITDMNSDRAAQIEPLIVDGATICVVWEGANGLNGVLTAAQAIAAHWVYTDAVRALGAKAIAVNCLPRNDAGASNPTFDNIRYEYNGLMAAQWRDHADAYVDLASIPEIGQLADTADTDYYYDLVHLTSAGYTLVADAIYDAIQSLVGE